MTSFQFPIHEMRIGKPFRPEKSKCWRSVQPVSLQTHDGQELTPLASIFSTVLCCVQCNVNCSYRGVRLAGATFPLPIFHCWTVLFLTGWITLFCFALECRPLHFFHPRILGWTGNLACNYDVGSSVQIIAHVTKW